MSDRSPAIWPRRLGVVVHPTRDVDAPLGEVRAWANEHGVDVVQVARYAHTHEVAPTGDAAECDLIVSIGGDGTMLAAIRAGMGVGRPALGIACGSLGVLTRTPPGEVAVALDAFSRGDWSPRRLPALAVQRSDGDELLALNDLAMVRLGAGQIRVTAHVDGVLFARLAGDGAIVSTPLGSSAYALAAGGPLLTMDNEGYVLTSLPTHGGTAPPLVLGPSAELELEIDGGYSGARLELDGQPVPGDPQDLAIRFRPAAATLVQFADQEPLLSVLRQRRVVVDSPRILAEDERISG